MSNLTKTSNASADVPRDSTSRETRQSNTLPIGPVLRRMRGEKSLRDVERDTGIANSHLCSVERGSQQPGLKFLGRMANYYQTSLAEIIRQAETPQGLPGRPRAGRGSRRGALVPVRERRSQTSALGAI